MPLHTSLLKPPEMRYLDEICGIIGEDKDLKRSFRGNFLLFLKENNAVDQSRSWNVSRVLAKPSRSRFDLAHYLYDFIVTTFVQTDVQRKKNLNKLYERLDKKITDLANLRQDAERMSLDVAKNIDTYTDFNDVKDVVPKEYLSKFLGYRLSASRGEVIRFFSKTSGVSNVPYKITFMNIYNRDQIQWKIDGSGYYFEETLYTLGHARDIANDGKTRGLRFGAYRRLNGSSILIGPLISMDRRGPIAARVVLIPFDKHNLGPKYEKLSEDQKIQLLIESGKEGDIFDEIKPQIADVMKQELDKDPEHLRYLLNNSTRTVLHGIPNREDEYSRLEQEVIEHALINGMNVDDTFSLALKNFLSTRKS